MSLESPELPPRPATETLEDLDEVARKTNTGDKKGLRSLALRFMRAAQEERKEEERDQAA